MKDYKIRTPYNFHFGEGINDAEHPDSISQTIPGMSVPLRDLLDRLVQGREVTLMREPVYEGHLNIPDVRTMDKVDRELYAKQVRAQVASYQQRLQEHNDKQRADHVAALEAKIKDLEQKAAAFSPVVSPAGQQ